MREFDARGDRRVPNHARLRDEPTVAARPPRTAFRAARTSTVVQIIEFTTCDPSVTASTLSATLRYAEAGTDIQEVPDGLPN
ncbi:hypothetical protein ACIA5H_35475 [Nocardia sp. NPDC051900]|uniref:hypothetical protein n=1 Tax=Nocardia sp. NPDC051900 TaxID=3364326 RepID=UPI00378DDF36